MCQQGCQANISLAHELGFRETKYLLATKLVISKYECRNNI